MIEKKDNKKLIWGSVLGFCLVSLLVAFILIAIDVQGKRFFGFDKMCMDFALDIRCGFLTVVFQIITNLVNPIVVGLIGFAILLFARRQRSHSFALFLNMGLVSLLNLGLKYVFGRPRPDEAIRLVSEVGYSFPSGHSMFAVAFYGYLIYMVWHLAWSKRAKIATTISGVVLILLIGLSRVYLGVHYATDIIGAFCISAVYLTLFLFFVKRTIKMSQTGDSEFKKHSFLGGFKYAGKGIISALQEENNLLVQFSSTMLVIVFGVALKISAVEWCICVVLCFVVMSLEFINTAFENLCDRVTMEHDEQIKKIKDISAGAVLTMSICALIVACIIFIPKIPFLF